MRFDSLSNEVIGCALRVHTTLGPGLLESAYAQCLALEFSARGVPFERELTVPIRYLGAVVDPGYRIDFLVASRLVLELKAVERLMGVHEAQVRTYMRLCGVGLGLLINFQVVLLRNGIRRLELAEADPRGREPLAAEEQR